MAKANFLVFLLFFTCSAYGCWISSIRTNEKIVFLNDPVTLRISLSLCDKATSVVAKIANNDKVFNARFWREENSTVIWTYTFEAFTKGQYEVTSVSADDTALPISHINEEERRFSAFGADIKSKRSTITLNSIYTSTHTVDTRTSIGSFDVYVNGTGFFDTTSFQLLYTLDNGTGYYAAIYPRNLTRLSDSLYVYKNATWNQWGVPGNYGVYSAYVYDYVNDIFAYVNVTLVNANLTVTSIYDATPPVFHSVELVNSQIDLTYSSQNYTLRLNASDDISGIRLSDLAVQWQSVHNVTRYLQGGRPYAYLSEGYMMITASLPCCVYPGRYQLIYMILYNNAWLNSINSNLPVYLNVTSVYDDIPPIVNSVSMLSHEVDTRHGDANFTIVANITELGGSGLSPYANLLLTSNFYYSTSSVYFSIYWDTYTEGSLLYGNVAVSRFFKADTFSVMALIAYDTNYNVFVYNTTNYPNMNWNFTVIPMNDTIGPVLHSIRAGTAFNAGFGKLLYLTVSDDLSGFSQFILNTVRSRDIYGSSYCYGDDFTAIEGDTNNGSFWSIVRCDRDYSRDQSNFKFAYSVTLFDNFGNNQTYPVQIYFQGQQFSCEPDYLEFRGNESYAGGYPLNNTYAANLTLCDYSDIDWFTLRYEEEVDLSVFLESVGNSIQISLSLYSEDAPTTVYTSGQLLTLDDQVISTTLKKNHTYYLSVAQKQYMGFANYTLQITINCNLTLKACYPYKVDAVNCVCNNVQQAPPYIDNTTIAEVVSNANIRKSNNSHIVVIVSVVVPVSVILLAIILFIVVRNSMKKRENEQRTASEVEMRQSIKPVTGDIDDIVVQQRLGAGQFGDVYFGIMKGSIPVALKMLKNVDAFDEFTNESNTLKSLVHKNIVHYYGTYVSSQGSRYIVTEFMSCGSVVQLFKQESTFSIKELLQMAIDAAEGMEYLESQNFIHRDLALRNLLAAESANPEKRFVIKVGDFGLSKALTTASYYKSESTALPIKWLSPEQIQFGKSSHQSDVYSFGVTMWEIFSKGKLPYEGFTNAEASQQIITENKLSKPENCLDSIYNLMLECWTLNPKERPSFTNIKEKLYNIYETIK